MTAKKLFTLKELEGDGTHLKFSPQITHSDVRTPTPEPKQPRLKRKK